MFLSFRGSAKAIYIWLKEDDYERYELYFSEAIGYIIRTDRSRTPLY